MAQLGSTVVAGGECAGEGAVGCVMRPCGREGARVEVEARWAGCSCCRSKVNKPVEVAASRGKQGQEHGHTATAKRGTRSPTSLTCDVCNVKLHGSPGVQEMASIFGRCRQLTRPCSVQLAALDRISVCPS